MPFGTPSEVFHGGFGLPEVEECIHTPEEIGTAMKHLSELMKEYQADKEIQEARELLVRALDQLYLLGYDSGFTNPAIEQLVTDIKFYLNGGRLNGT